MQSDGNQERFCRGFLVLSCYHLVNCNKMLTMQEDAEIGSLVGVTRGGFGKAPSARKLPLAPGRSLIQPVLDMSTRDGKRKGVNDRHTARTFANYGTYNQMMRVSPLQYQAVQSLLQHTPIEDETLCSAL